MKCPKCGYLGFETTDRCRNCQYDFSLAPFKTEVELSLQDGSRAADSPLDFELPPISRTTDSPAPSALDLDRLFGDPEPGVSALPPVTASDSPAKTVREGKSAIITESPPPDIQSRAIESDAVPAPALVMALDADRSDLGDGPETAAELAATPTGKSGLPFDDSPMVPPPAARPPLAVRRSTPEMPRTRPRMTRPNRTEALDFEPTRTPSEVPRTVSETVASLMESPSLAVRISAGLIDTLLLIAIDAAVVFLTLRVTGLQNTLDDLRVLPPVPFVGFLVALGFGYIAAFTIAGGQTVGKMALNLRVIGDDGRRVDAAGGMIRALGCLLVPVTLGLSYLPAFFTSDHRALHDRLAGTRVVKE